MEHHGVLGDDGGAAGPQDGAAAAGGPCSPEGDEGAATIGQVPAAGIVTDLGTLPREAVITETALSAMFGRHQCSIKRAAQRGALPTPCRLFGKNVWTAAALVRHLEERQAAAAHEREVLERRLAGLRP